MVGMFSTSCDVQGRGTWLYLGRGGGVEILPDDDDPAGSKHIANLRNNRMIIQ
jgi:hypothetical protein